MVHSAPYINANEVNFVQRKGQPNMDPEQVIKMKSEAMI